MHPYRANTGHPWSRECIRHLEIIQPKVRLFLSAEFRDGMLGGSLLHLCLGVIHKGQVQSSIDSTLLLRLSAEPL